MKFSIVWIISFIKLVVAGDQYCLEGNYDLCLGYSGNATVGKPLQLKHRHKRILKEDVITWENNCDDQDGLCVPMVNNTLFVDKLRGTRRVGLSRESAGVNHVNGKLELFNSSNCLTVVECASGGGEFCNPFSVRAVMRVGQLQEGAYIVLKECRQNETVSQNFLINPDCRKGCTQQLLMNTRCDQECNYAECFWDFGLCNSTYSPTPKRFKTPKPTHLPTKLPTYNPTTQPTVEPTGDPTIQPSVEPTGHPTIQPTIFLMTESPSFNPTVSLTVSPTMLPTRNPSLNPSTSPTKRPTRSPTINIITTLSPTNRPSESVKPETVTGSPTGIESLTSGGFVALWVILVLLFILVLCGIIYYFYKKRKETVQHPQTRLPTDPPRIS
jgi:hypothetical protein